MKNIFFLAFFIFFIEAGASAQTITPNDGSWSKMTVSLKIRLKPHI